MQHRDNEKMAALRGEVDRVYTGCRDDSLPVVDRSYRTEALALLAGQMATNASLHVTTNFQKRLKKWCLVRPSLLYSQTCASRRGKADILDTTHAHPGDVCLIASELAAFRAPASAPQEKNSPSAWAMSRFR